MVKLKILLFVSLKDAYHLGWYGFSAYNVCFKDSINPSFPSQASTITIIPCMMARQWYTTWSSIKQNHWQLFFSLFISENNEREMIWRDVYHEDQPGSNLRIHRNNTGSSYWGCSNTHLRNLRPQARNSLEKVRNHFAKYIHISLFLKMYSHKCMH